MADDVQMVQLFQNLVGNAVKYRSERRPEIHVSSQSNDREWILSVRDNGIGIDMAFAEKIFAVFRRLHRYEQYPGAGIGLSICKRIVERHGGRIWLESEAGAGSTFFFTLPRAMEPRA
jgi:light-regulated signal transduction histidine kinase (bacteriophytochrome)